MEQYMIKTAVLVSGAGTNREAMSTYGVPITLVLADRPCCALETARASRISTAIVSRTDFTRTFDAERKEYTRHVLDVLRAWHIDFVILAGFRTVLAQIFFDAYGDERALNMHDSILPAFPGAYAIRDALRAGVKETGCTLHVATKNVDNGRVLVQGKVRIVPGDTEEKLRKKKILMI